jgi:hypothetical protein
MSTSIGERLRRLAPPDAHDSGPSSLIAGVGTVVGLMALYAVYRTVIEGSTSLSPAGYEGSVLLVEALKQPRTLLLFAVPLAAMFVRRKKTTWEAMQDGRVVRIVIGVACVVSAWAFSTYDFNVYLGQAHLLDRALLVALAAAVFWTPKVVAVFLPYVMLIVDQFNHPFRFGQADKTLLFKALMLFVAFLLLRLVLDIPGRMFIYATGILVAGNFVLSGVDKLRIGWLSNDLSHLWMSAHINGFPGWMSTKAALDIGDFIHRFNVLLLAGTLLIEIGFVALWWFRRATPAILVAGVMLHVAIFLSSGIFFWKWIVLELALAGAVYVIGWQRVVDAVGGRWPAAALSTVLILAAPLYAEPVSLSWLDSPVTYSFELSAITPDGRVPVARHFFSPYDLVFSQNRFTFLSDEPTPVGTFASTASKQRLSELLAVRTCSDLDLLESRLPGRPKLGQRRAFERFVRTYMKGSRAPADRGLGWRVLEWVQAPPHIWVQTPPPRLKADQAVDAIEVRRERTIYRDGELIRCTPEPLVRIRVDVPAD